MVADVQQALLQDISSQKPKKSETNSAPENLASSDWVSTEAEKPEEQEEGEVEVIMIILLPCYFQC